ncbi:hypothetical protein BGZ96_000487 [Linnemannia gamsii]|uniref:C2H2-type domain-containing protein n=1 Tax=Linnemannia gamsii TaxID=64522 RepID=A0ABQ7JNX5_9FUNG|nr:hypothetical protein BGZ96_000487 [Linnemannia gamsii]
MDRHHSQQQQQQQQQPPTPAAEVTSSTGPIDFSGPYGPVSTTTNMPMAPMAPVYPLLAQALEREGFPGLASMLAYTHEQHQLEQVTLQSALEHQYSNSYNPADSTATAAPFPQEQTMVINNSPTDAGNNTTDPALQDPNNPYNLMGGMAPFELLQYNSLVFDHQLFDALPYSVNASGAGGCGDGMDPNAWCDTPQALGLNTNGIFADQFSHVIQPSQQQQGYFNPSIPSSSGSSSAGSSSSAGASSSSAGHFGLNVPSWAAAAGLYPQNDYLMDRKREGAGMPGQAMLPGAVIAPRVVAQAPFESPEDDTDDEDDESGDEEYPGDDNVVPPLSLPKRNSRRASQGLKHERDEEEPQYQQQLQQPHHQYHQQQQHSQHYQQHHHHQSQHQQNHLSHSHYSHQSQHGQQYHHHHNNSISSSSSHPQQSYEHQSASSSKRARMDSLTVGSASTGPRRLSGAPHSPAHSRNSSISSVHSLLSSLEHNYIDPSSSKAGPSTIKGSSPTSSSGSPSGSSSKFTRPQSDTIEKRMHPCTFEGCDKSFTRAFNLRSHVNTHNGERPHKCPEPGCDWDFVRRHDLDRHVKSKHLANKPYACNQCTSRFGRSDALQRHRRLENHF